MDKKVKAMAEDRPLHPAWGTAMLFALGLAILSFLVLIDREEWFHIRPVSGTAVAMSYAADRAPVDDAARR